MTKERKSICKICEHFSWETFICTTMNYQLLCTDIDGTLLNKEREVSTSTIAQFERVKKECHCVLASSRMPDAMRHLQRDLSIEGSPLIAYNGGLVLANDEVLTSMEIPLDVVAKISHLAEGTDIHVSIYHHDDWFVPMWDYWAEREANNTKITPTIRPLEETLKVFAETNRGAHKVMCMGPAEDIAQLYQALDAAHSNELHVYKSKDTYLEIANKKISKKSAIQTLLNEVYNQVAWEEVIAFGDNYNDIEMLTAAGMGVAVGNAKTAVLAVANHVTSSNKEDGVAQAMKALMV